MIRSRQKLMLESLEDRRVLANAGAVDLPSIEFQLDDAQEENSLVESVALPLSSQSANAVSAFYIGNSLLNNSILPFSCRFFLVTLIVLFL